jgi:peptidoglycan hydrolase-like protein with peptidoglycan-binding domain
MADVRRGGHGRAVSWRRAGVLAGLGALVAGGAAAAVTAGLAGPGRPGAQGGVAVATARVVRTNLVNTVQVSGSLGYAGSVTIVDQLQGTTYTALPWPGEVARRGRHLFEVNGSPVILFYGRRPEWRDLSLGVTNGPDVAQLDANLIALGYATAGTLTVSDAFGFATAYAVERWQAATGLPVTGVVPAGQIAYAPGPLRVTTVAPALGGLPQPGSAVLTATSDDPVVSSALPVSQEYLVRQGDRVSVTLPDGTTTAPGVVASVSRVATVASGFGAASDGSAPAPSGGGSGNGGGSSAAATVELTVALAHPRVAGNLDQAPVTVNITSARARNVLAVPVSALVALAGGGYAVEVPARGGQRLVGVRTGLFDATLVQVTGAGLRPGTPVQVPAP